VWPLRLLALAAAVAAPVALTGCAGQSSSAPSSSKISGGVALATAGNAFYAAEAKGAADKAKAENVQLNVQYADSDLDKQSSQIDAFIRDKVDFIVIDAVDSDGIGPAVLRAKQAGIKVVAIDAAASGADAAVFTDNVKAGEMTCDYLIKQIGEKGKFALADSIPISVIKDRIDGCKKALAKAPNVTVVSEQRADNSRDGGLKLGSEVLTAQPDIDAIFAVNDPQAAGVALAAKQKGNSHVIIGGVDGSSQALDVIKSGGPIVVTAAQYPEALGSRGIELALGLLDGVKPKENPELMVPGLVTEDNVEKYTRWD